MHLDAFGRLWCQLLKINQSFVSKLGKVQGYHHPHVEKKTAGVYWILLWNWMNDNLYIVFLKGLGQLGSCSSLSHENCPQLIPHIPMHQAFVKHSPSSAALPFWSQWRKDEDPAGSIRFSFTNVNWRYRDWYLKVKLFNGGIRKILSSWGFLKIISLDSMKCLFFF